MRKRTHGGALRKTPKRILCIMIALVLVVTLVPLSALADGEQAQTVCSHPECAEGDICTLIETQPLCLHPECAGADACTLNQAPLENMEQSAAVNVVVTAFAPLQTEYTVAIGEEPKLPTKLAATDASGTDIEIGVVWSCEAFDSSVAKSYTFTAALPDGYTAAPDVALPQIAVTVKEAKDASEEDKKDTPGDKKGAKTVTAITPLEEDALRVEVPFGTPEEEIGLPQTLAGSIAQAEGDPIDEDIPVVWTCEDYDAELAGEYVFSAALAKGYAAGDALVLPQITVIIKEAEMATMAIDGYAESDVAAINKLITDNNLGAFGWKVNEPSVWAMYGLIDTGSSSAPDLRVQKLTVEGDLSSYLSLTGNVDLSALTALQHVDIKNHRELNSVNLSGNIPNLTSVNLDRCFSMTNLTLPNAPANLEILSVSDSKLTSLNVTAYTKLTSLNCRVNEITSLNVSGLNALTRLDCDSGQLASLTLGTVPSLKILYCSDNKLTSLDVSGASTLDTLACAENQLTSLNVSGLTSLRSIDCKENQLTTITGLNTLSALRTLDFSGNKLTTLSLGGLGAIREINCANNAFTSLSLTGPSTLTTLNCSNNENLASLTLSNLASITNLNCDNPLLTSVDFSVLPALAQLTFGGTKNMETLTLTGMNSLTTLNTKNNASLHTLTLTNMPVLEEVDCGENEKLATLSLTNVPAITKLDCMENAALTALNLTSLSNLKTLNIMDTGISSLNLSSLTKLEMFYCSGAPLTNASLNLSGLTKLETLAVSGTKITGTYNPGSLPSLKMLFCSETDITGLDLRGCPALSMLHINLTPNLPMSGITFNDASAITFLDCNEKGLTGTLDASIFPNLKELRAWKNNLSAINTTGLVVLENLDCSENNITSLDLRTNAALSDLQAYDNKLTELYVSGLANLDFIMCDNNNLTSIDFTGCTHQLLRISAENNKLAEIKTPAGNTLRILPAAEGYGIFNFFSVSDGGYAEIQGIANDPSSNGLSRWIMSTPVTFIDDTTDQSAIARFLYPVGDLIITPEFSAARVNGVKVLPETVAVERGKTQQFTAEVDAEGVASKDVTWSVESAVSHIDGQGLLTVSEYEGQSVLTVKATSVHDTTKVGTAYVTVTGDAPEEFNVLQHFTEYNGDKKSRTATIDATHWNFAGLFLEGNKVPDDAITVVKGSTVITLSGDYLHSLPNGNHTFTAQYRNGFSRLPLTVNKPADPVNPVNPVNPNPPGGGTTATTAAVSPRTGDSASLGLWTCLLLIAGAAALAMLIYSKKQKAMK